MTYTLGIDIGTSYTAAAIWRADASEQGKAEVVSLGNRTASIASVLFLGADGSIVVGEAAQRRALTDPDRVVREFKRRIGDDTPLIVGGQPVTAHNLAATMVRWVVDRVAEREGGPAAQIAITHPAGWGPYKKDLLRRALAQLGLGDFTFLPEPEAAAISYASLERVEPGRTIAVYDLGGGTFDAAVVRKSDDGSFELLGSPDGLEQVGGADFDEAVLTHVQTTLGSELGTGLFDAVDVEDPNVLTALARLRRECTEAKEALSSDTEVSIPVLLPGLNTHVRLVRGEFEEMIRSVVQDTVDSLSRAIRSAGVTSQELGAVLLVGGSSRVPLVSQLVSAELRCPVVVDADPKTTIALGAALSLATHTEPAGVTPAPAEPAEATPDRTAPISTAAVAGLAAGAAQRLPDTDKQAPHRPPVNSVEPGFNRGSRSTEDGVHPRRRLVAVVALTVMTLGLITGALLSPVATSLGIGQTATDGPADTSPGGSPGTANAEDPAKMSVTGSPNASRGRANAADVVQTTAAEPGADTDPVTKGTRGGRSTTPAPPPKSAAQPPSPTPRKPSPAPGAPPGPPTSQPTGPSSGPPSGPPTSPPTDPPTDPPATDPPATDPPATDPPATDPPATDPPATDPPATDPPSTGAET